MDVSRSLESDLEPDHRLPVHDRSVVRVEAGQIRTRFSDLRLELLFIDRDAEARFGQQRPVTVLDRRQRLRQEIGVSLSPRSWMRKLGIAAATCMLAASEHGPCGL